MGNQNSQQIINVLGSGISERNVRKVATSLRDFIMTYLPDPSNLEDVRNKRSALDKEFGLEDDLHDDLKFLRQAGIRELLQTFDEGIDGSYLFGFLGGGSGFGRLYFDCVENTVRYPVGDYPDIQKRFVDLYGVEPVRLNID